MKKLILAQYAVNRAVIRGISLFFDLPDLNWTVLTRLLNLSNSLRMLWINMVRIALHHFSALRQQLSTINVAFWNMGKLTICHLMGISQLFLQKPRCKWMKATCCHSAIIPHSLMATSIVFLDMGLRGFEYDGSRSSVLRCLSTSAFGTDRG